MWNAVETVDYIFDRYAFLGLETDASIDEIKAAIKAKRLENHPDRLVKAGKEVKAAAERVLSGIAQCEELLLNPDRKAHFDAKLEWFKAKRPAAISNDGTAIILVSEMHLDVPTLLGLKGDDAAQDNLERPEIIALTGYDPKKSEKLRRLHAKDPQDTDVKGMLIDALQAELMYLHIAEEKAWQRVGLFNVPNKTPSQMIDPADYADETSKRLDKVMDQEIPQLLGDTLGLARLGMASPMLLLPPPAKQESANLPAQLEDVTVEDLVARARETMARSRGQIHEVSLRKQAILGELAELIEVVWLTPEPRRAGDYFMFLIIGKDEEEPFVYMALKGNDHDRHLESYEDSPMLGKTLTELRQETFDVDAVAFAMNPELEMPLIAVGPIVNKRLTDLGLLKAKLEEVE
jgi:curved DNA-binding protein CbpA